ncbi:MAG: hypothetical protein ABRQ39_25650 [Candidatus Eremiobacterota bacterium]
MRCNKCGEVTSDFSDICYKCNKSNITTQLDMNKEIKCPDFSPGNETCILEQNKYSSNNRKEIIRLQSHRYEPAGDDYEEQSIPVRIIKPSYNPINLKLFSVAPAVTVVLVISFIFLKMVTEDQNRSFKKGLSQCSQGIFRTYRNGEDMGSPASFEKSFSKWNKNEDNAKISYLLAVSCYYDYLNLKIIGANNDPSRINQNMNEMKLYLDRALDLKPEYPEAFYYRGLYYLEINDYSKAIIEFNKCTGFAGLIWKSEPEKQFKWSSAAKIAEEETGKISMKETSLKSVPPIIADFCGHLRLIMDGKGRASIKDKDGNFIFIDKLCPSLPDEVSNR